MSSIANTTHSPTVVDYDPFAGSAILRVVPTTESQREVWLADQFGEDASLAFNESVSLRFKGPLQVDALIGALQELVQRHEALRATTSANGEELVIAADAVINVELSNFTSLNAVDQDANISAARQRVVETPFHVEKGPLFRAEILKFGSEDHFLILTAHHIICDGWSFGIIVRDLAKLYAHRTNGIDSALAPARSFGDYASALADAHGNESQMADEKYWLSRFTGTPPVLDLPTDRARPVWRTFSARREDYVLDAALVADVRKIGALSGSSLFATLLSSFAALIQRVGGSTDVVIGVPAAGQSVGGYENLVGHCVNLLPLRLDVNPASSAGDLISATQTAMLDAYEHQSYTFGTLLKKLAVARDTSRLPLVSVMFNIDQILDANAAGFPEVTVDFASNARSFENFELFVNAVQTKGALRLECQYNADLFDAATVRRWLACYEVLLRSTCASADTCVGMLAMLPNQDRQMLAEWNATSVPFSQDALIHELFESQAKRVPDRQALFFLGVARSYRELDAHANRIAHCLRECGVRRGALVGLHLKRGPDMVAAMLAVLKAGAAYVPLDPTYPVDRLNYMAEDAALTMLVTESSAVPRLDWPTSQSLLLDQDNAQIVAKPDSSLPNDGSEPQPTDSAYVIYTSGSTGRPKGVRVPHHSVVNFLQSMAKEPGLSETDRMVAVTTLSFDIAVNELLLPLCIGAQIVLAAPEESSDGTLLAKLIAKSGATVMQATPATWRLLIEADWRGSKTFKALCGGEALSIDLAHQLAERTGALWNMYGPTETTVWSTCWRVTDFYGPIRIGRPIANTSVWIVDEQRQICPVGVPGEIWIGGEGVTLGYLNRDELTAERFVADPFSKISGARIYRTGDRGRWRTEGQLEHLGRLDFQVKVRGYRIELGEIEATLSMYADILQVVVLAREDRPGDVRLVAYFVATPGAVISEEALKAYLNKTLPDYMVPLHTVRLLTIPLLSNGKVDRKSLPAPQMTLRRGPDFIAARTELEKAVSLEMEASLGMPGLDIHDDFFALGGHSLLAAQLTSRLNQRFKSNLSMRTLFAAPTIERLANAIDAELSASGTIARKPIDVLPDRHVAPMSLMQERLWFLEELYPGRVTYNAPSAHRLLGFMNEAAFERAFKEMMRRQASLRTSFESRGNVALQRIHDHVPISLFPAEDLSNLSPVERERRLLERLDELTAETFDLTRVPLFKVRMFRMNETEHVLFFMPHHIIWDGWSFDLVYEEMAALYGAFATDRANPLSELRTGYGDFAAWHRDWTTGKEFEKQLDYWRGRLETLKKTEELPTDTPRRPGMSGTGNTEWIVIDKARTDALHELSRRSGTTLFATTLAAYCVLLYTYSRQTTLVVGTPVRGRNSLELERIMGYFNNLLPLQFEIDPNKFFTDLIEQVKAVVVDSFAYPDVPLEQLSRELSAMQGARGSVLYQALFSFQDARQRIRRWGALSHEVVPLFQRGATEDLGMWFVESEAGLYGGVTYNTDILTNETAKKLHRCYLYLIDAIIASPGRTITSLIDTENEFKAQLRSATHGGTDAVAASLTTHEVVDSVPTTDTEKLLASIWRAQLKLPQVGRHDNFFDLGGHSLLAVQSILAMEQKTGKRVDRSRFIFETLAQIAKSYDDAKPEPPLKPGGLRGLFSGLLGGKKS